MRFIFFYKILWHKNRETNKKCKENEVKILLFHNLQYKKEKLRDFFGGLHSCVWKNEGISFSCHLYQVGTPWPDRSSEGAPSWNEILHVRVCSACMCVKTFMCVSVRCFPITAVSFSLFCEAVCHSARLTVLSVPSPVSRPVLGPLCSRQGWVLSTLLVTAAPWQ